MISIRVLKIGDESICKPPEISAKEELNNSLMPVSSKTFERLLYDSMFKFFTENSLISQNQ